ncbi:DUF982 domain-containing protein [Neorhizobium sp. NCHU2750]|uniref:DUF982 domain-containing protein n=1 Tax=Neorhizobium sp. NCHU2750 TaxID=1825976 RepID=UPI000EB6481C|nr:hypothetical protein NCHU2750_13540 [Neorhizobium sp. NCHU2750]
METGTWKTPVVIEMYGRPGTVFITSTLDAALMLVGAWPTMRTDMHMLAVRSCRNVLTGSGEPALARATFIEAAIEAGYRIEPETFLSDRWDLTPLPDDTLRPALGLAALISRRTVSAAGETGDSPMQEDSEDSSSPAPAPLPYQPIAPSGHPQLGELIGRLFLLLGQIGLEVLRSLGGLLTGGMTRRASRQAH